MDTGGKTAGPPGWESALQRLRTYFAQSELLNRLQPPEVRSRRVALNWLHRKRVHESTRGGA